MRRHHRYLAAVISFTWLITVIALPAELSLAAGTARVTPSGDGIEVEYASDAGTISKEVIPLMKSGDIRYFSAGVGVEERQVHYPPFPLKIILVAGDKAYLSRTSITISDAPGAVRLQIPEDHVAGPWVFVDLPPGTYKITGTRDGQSVVTDRVSVRADGTTTVYLRWG
jgi:hypothetical protein